MSLKRKWNEIVNRWWEEEGLAAFFYIAKIGGKYGLSMGIG